MDTWGPARNGMTGIVRISDLIPPLEPGISFQNQYPTQYCITVTSCWLTHHPPPSLPIASGDVSPHESTWDHYGSSLPVVFIEDYDLPATSSIVPSPPMDINKDRVSLWDKDRDSYPTMESDSILSPSVTTATSHMEWGHSSNDCKWQEVPSLDHHVSVDVEASYRFSNDVPKGCGCDHKQWAKECWIRAVALLRLWGYDNGVSNGSLLVRQWGVSESSEGTER